MIPMIFLDRVGFNERVESDEVNPDELRRGHLRMTAPERGRAETRARRSKICR
jgi:hypothetical protein